MPVKTAVAQAPLPDGGRYELPGGLVVDERASRLTKGRGRGNLYVLLEISGEEAGRSIVAAELTEMIRQLYYGWRGSITAGLQEAIRETNKALLEENRNALPGEQWAAGVSCAVLRENELFIAQAGPAAVFLASDNEIVRYPDVSPWLDDIPPEDMDAAPLGGSRDVNVSLFHTQVGNDDTLLLLTSAAARNVAEDAWPQIVSGSPVETVIEALSKASRTHDPLALAVRLGEEGTGSLSASRAAPAMVSPDPGLDLQSAWESISEWADELNIQEHLQNTGAVVGTALVGLFAALLTFFKGLIPGEPSPIPPPPRKPATKKTPKGSARPRSKTKEPDASVQKTLTWAAIAIPLIVAVIVILTYSQRGQSQRLEQETLLQEAYTRWDQSLAVSDPTTARTLLAQSAVFLDQILEREPDHPEAVGLYQRIQSRQDELNQVNRINWIAALRAYPPNAQLSRIVVEGVHIFVMDRSAGKVYHHQLDDHQQALKPESENSVLVSSGEQIGDILVGDLVDMTWMPVGNDWPKANLLILESGGSLIEYDPATGERVAIRVAAAEQRQNPQLVGSYYGRFYLLDPAANRLWRYSPTLDGYSRPPEDWLQAEVDLADVVDMAIGNSIYLLYADGKMRKLTAGAPDTFDISDWDSPPQNPSALFTRPPEDTQWVYVADSGNSRIVQVNKEGHFKRQFRLGDTTAGDGSDHLRGVTSLFVDEISGHAYFVSNQQLFIAILPE